MSVEGKEECHSAQFWVRLCLFRLPIWVKDTWHWSHWKGRLPVWIRMCFVKWLFWVKVLKHRSHLKGRFPVWMRLCLFRLPIWVKDAWHWSHWKGRNPVWIRMCIVKWLFWLKDLEHWLHWRGRSLVWTHMCVVRVFFWVKDLEHWWHLKGRSPVWMRMCLCRLPIWAKDAQHWVHWKGRSLVWIRMCTVRLPFCLKDFWHTVHWWVRVPVRMRRCSGGRVVLFFWVDDLEHWVASGVAWIRAFTTSACPLCAALLRSVLPHLLSLVSRLALAWIRTLTSFLTSTLALASNKAFPVHWTTSTSTRLFFETPAVSWIFFTIVPVRDLALLPRTFVVFRWWGFDVILPRHRIPHSEGWWC